MQIGKKSFESKWMYLRSKRDESVLAYFVIDEDDLAYKVGRKTSKGFEAITMTKHNFLPATVEEFEQEKWANESKQAVIGSLYKETRVPYRRLKRVEEMIKEEMGL